MKRVPAPIMGMDSQARYDTLANSRLYNMFPESVTSDGKQASAFIRWLGKSEYASIATGEVRGMWKASTGTGYAVIGDTVYKVALGVLTSIGTITTAAGRVSMRDNGTQLMLVDGVFGYIVTLATNVMVKITDVNFPNGTRYISYIDTYFICGMPSTQQYFISAFNNGLSWNALDFGTAESDPDYIVCNIELNRALYLIGVNTTEIMTDSGDVNYPFTRSALIETGCIAPDSVVKADGGIFMIGQNKDGAGVIVRLSGSSAIRVSTHPIEYQISKMIRIDDAIATSFQDGGHTFIQFTFPTDSKSFTFDVSTQAWFETGYLDSGVFSRDRMNCHMFHEGKHLVGDYANGKIYTASQGIYSDNGNDMVCLRSFRMPDSQRKRVMYSRIELDLEFGVGLDGGGLYTDPKVMIRYSNDNGKTWSSSRTAQIGKIGEYTKRAYLFRCGTSRTARIWEISYSEQTPFAIAGAVCDVEECNA